MVDEGRVRRITDEICRYLATRPGAADTLEGIETSWVAWRTRTSDVEQAVAALVEDGVLERRVLANGTAVYGMRRRGRRSPG